jgi:hypothetical protein
MGANMFTKNVASMCVSQLILFGLFVPVFSEQIPSTMVRFI